MPLGERVFYAIEVIIMWIKTENGAIVNLNRVTVIRVEELDTSLIQNEDKPWGTVWHTDGMNGIVARYATKEAAENALTALYTAIR